MKDATSGNKNTEKNCHNKYENSKPVHNQKQMRHKQQKEVWLKTSKGTSSSL